jgi:succinyl-CoA synthetase alpha subunit/citrate synthase
VKETAVRPKKTKPFPYFVGVYSLEELVSRDSRVCVVNILGNESRKVTPVSHAYSGGNVVAGVQYGRSGVLETPAGDIPVYPSVLAATEAGRHFDTGVIYLPPSAVAQAASELVTYNPDLKRIVIVTEKVPTSDSRNIRFICQEAGVDVIGANCLGVANVWDRVRVGGALGGDHPEETLRAGSVAIHSNSGNFTTTIAEYLRIGGFGVSTAVSSGKDIYIHFALPEFLYAAQNDPRTKAVALYVEPGGYYEDQALTMIRDRVFAFNKPMVVCVTGRWKTGIARSCGHAGALAGSGDDAACKEQWFDDFFGVPVFDPANPRVSKQGVRVSSIQHIPEAMRAVFELIDEPEDFAPDGDLSLKPWIRDTRVTLPPELEIPLVRPIAPYDEQLRAIDRLVGAQPLRRPMRNSSGASRMDPKTQVAELHRVPVLELSTRPLEDNLFFALAKEFPGDADRRAFNTLLHLCMRLAAPDLEAAARARAAGATPNGAAAVAVAELGNPAWVRRAREHAATLIDLIREHGIEEHTEHIPAELDIDATERLFVERAAATPTADAGTGQADPITAALVDAVRSSENECAALRVTNHLLDLAEERGVEIEAEREFLLAAVAVCLFWRPMLERRITRQSVEDAIAHLASIVTVVACTMDDPETNPRWKRCTGTPLHGLADSFTETAFALLFGRDPTPRETDEFRTLLGLTITNGPGTLSAKGAKESVSARNHLSIAYLGFLANTGLAHGGNGFEAVKFLLGIFDEAGLTDPTDPGDHIDLDALARRAATRYAAFKREQKALGVMRPTPIPCINHPVFRGAEVNIDPREDFVAKRFAEAGIPNVFLDFYHRLVVELHEQGVTGNVFCVNIDAVLAVIALKLAWNELKGGRMSERRLQEIVFSLFLVGRVTGITAEITDHLDRGRDMDCRTPQSELGFVL